MVRILINPITLNLFDLQPILINFIKFSAADQTSAMQEQMSGAAGSMPQDPKAAFKAEWEALEITEYQNVLQNVETEAFATISDSLQVLL